MTDHTEFLCFEEDEDVPEDLFEEEIIPDEYDGEYDEYITSVELCGGPKEEY